MLYKCCSIYNKQSELEVFLIITFQNTDFFCGTESHLDSSILSTEFIPKIMIFTDLTEIDTETVF